MGSKLPLFLPPAIPKLLNSPLSRRKERQAWGQELSTPRESTWVECVFHFPTASVQGPSASKPWSPAHSLPSPAVLRALCVLGPAIRPALPGLPEPQAAYEPPTFSQDRPWMVTACVRLYQPVPAPLHQGSWPGPGLAGSGSTGPALGLA